MPTIAEIVREYIPDASDELVEFVTWEKTGYPSFWCIPEDGETPEECFRKQVKEAAEKMMEGTHGRD